MRQKDSKNKKSKLRQIQMDIMDLKLSQNDHFRLTGTIQSHNLWASFDMKIQMAVIEFLTV